MLALRSLGKIKGISRIIRAHVHDFVYSVAQIPDEYR